ncbi:MAG: transporter [Gemmatimonadaceae bacterium]
MAASVQSIVLYSAIPVLTTALGAAFAAFRPPSVQLRNALQHFAAGVVFSVVAVELLPDVVRVHDPFEIGWTFAAGVALMLSIERLTKRSGSVPASGEKLEVQLAGPSAGQLTAIGIDIFIDGLLIGIAFAAGSSEGVLLTLALSLELLSLGLAVASGLVSRGRVRTILVPTTLSLLLVVGAVIGETMLRDVSEHTLAGVLSFGCAALLYLVTEELLVEAHESGETTLGTAMFFVGFLAFLLLGMVS